MAKAAPIVLDSDFVDELESATAEVKREQKREQKEKGSALGEVEVLSALFGIPQDSWEQILNSTRLVVSPIQRSIIGLIREGKVPSAKQAQVLVDLLERASEEGIVLR